MRSSEARSVRAVGKVAERAVFAEWLFDPNRQPRTQKEWAQLHGVSEGTRSDWKRTAPEVLEAAEAFRESPAVAVGFAEATMVMLRAAKNGHVNAYRAAAPVLGEVAPQKIDQTVRGMSLAEFLMSATYSVSRVDASRSLKASIRRSCKRRLAIRPSRSGSTSTVTSYRACNARQRAP